MDLARDETITHRLVGLAEDLFHFGKQQTSAAISAKTAEVLTPAEIVPSKPYELATQALSESPTPPEPSNARRPHKEPKIASELAQMIERDLMKHPDCPRQGFRVTVYGATHWRAMLTIMPAAARVRNAQQLRELTDELADHLRQRYDLAWE
jgi:hypothetical protein